MPIIEPARTGTPLTQGDLLSGIALFATKGSWDEKGGQASVVKSELCLVLSRPCVAAHKKHVVVAAIAAATVVVRQLEALKALRGAGARSSRKATCRRLKRSWTS